MEQIRKLAPALQMAGAAIPQQRQVGPMPTARQLQPQASNPYANTAQGQRMQDPSWMLRQLKGSGHPQAHAGSGNPALQQSWATPTHMQVWISPPSSAWTFCSALFAVCRNGSLCRDVCRFTIQRLHMTVEANR